MLLGIVATVMVAGFLFMAWVIGGVWEQIDDLKELGTVGPAGPQGPQGPMGIRGERGESLHTHVVALQDRVVALEAAAAKANKPKRARK